MVCVMSLSCGSALQHAFSVLKQFVQPSFRSFSVWGSSIFSAAVATTLRSSLQVFCRQVYATVLYCCRSEPATLQHIVAITALFDSNVVYCSSCCCSRCVHSDTLPCALRFSYSLRRYLKPEGRHVYGCILQCTCE